jgi:hypothetical protein
MRKSIGKTQYICDVITVLSKIAGPGLAYNFNLFLPDIIASFDTSFLDLE